MFLCLPSTLDRKEEFLQWKSHVHLHPIDVSYDDLKELNNGIEAHPALLDEKPARKEVTTAFYKAMKKIAEILDQNLIRNSDAYITNGGKNDPDNQFSWVDDSYYQAKETFQLSYLIIGTQNNIWTYLHEDLQLRPLSYLNPDDLISLCYVSKYFRKLLLHKF